MVMDSGPRYRSAGISRCEERGRKIERVVVRYFAASLAEKVEKRLVKQRRRLDLRGVAQIRKLDQLRVRHARRRRLAEHRVIAERGADGRRRQILANGGGVFVAYDQADRRR